jgi:hypothetical protein
MQRFRLLTLAVGWLTVIAMFVFSTGCTSDSSKNGNGNLMPSSGAVANQDSPSDKLEDLKLLIRVPYEAEDAVWRVDPRTKKLTAVIIFTPEDSAKLLAELKTKGEGTSAEIALESWFPEELIAKSEMSGDSELRGTSYSADPFFLDPYKNGRVIHIEETEIFVIELRPGE